MNSKMLTELRRISEQEGTITAQASRRLSLAALADVYELVGEVSERADKDHEDVAIVKTEVASLKKRSNIVDTIIAFGTIFLGIKE